MPRAIPTAHLGRLAVDQAAEGQGLGSVLVADALQRTLRAAQEIAISEHRRWRDAEWW